MLQAPAFDGLFIDPFSLFDDCVGSPEVGVGGRQFFLSARLLLQRKHWFVRCVPHGCGAFSPGGSAGLVVVAAPDGPAPMAKEPTMTKNKTTAEAHLEVAQGATLNANKTKKPGAAAGSALSYPPDLRLLARADDELENGTRAARRGVRKRKPSAPRRAEASSDPIASGTKKTLPKITKTEAALKALRRKRGASLVELQEVTGWQAHSVRGFLSGTVKKKLGLAVTREIGKDGVRRYRIDDAMPAEQAG